MTPTTYPDLLKSLRGLEKHLAAAYARTARADDRIRAQVTARWAAAEVGGRLDDYIDLSARRSAVRFLLRTVYVRVLEDLGALRPLRIRGDAGLVFFREVAPGLGIRSYLRFVFRDLAKDFPALFAPSGDELPLPDEEDCKKVWDLWHEKVGDAPRFAWAGDEAFDSRFLGDLYQDLDAEVRKHFALLQTPHFVESYILDKTLTPALVEFDPEALRARGETFRLLDPTCGSGHFLIGGWKRLARLWEERGCDRWEAATRALDSVWGADINAHAVDIARFRLLLEVIAWTGERDLERLKELPFQLEVMDSLIPWERTTHAEEQGTLFPGRDRLAEYSTPLERSRNALFLGQQFHLVVGNPPYIAPRDERKAKDYRLFWPNSCFKEYTLNAPFLERFAVLGIYGAYIGQITGNNFAKRTFGKAVITKVLRQWRTLAVVDSSLAPIPGHGWNGGTSTVILFGKKVPFGTNPVPWVLARRREATGFTDPAESLSWRALATADWDTPSSGPYVAVEHRPPDSVATYPWDLRGDEGGGITEAMEAAPHRDLITLCKGKIGTDVITRAPEAFEWTPSDGNRLNIPTELLRRYYVGDDMRDWSATTSLRLLVPYADRKVVGGAPFERLNRSLWSLRRRLSTRYVSGGVTLADKGLSYVSLPQVPWGKHEGDELIAYPFVTTEPHFSIQTASEFFKNSVNLITLKLRVDLLDVLGALNSSSSGYWLRGAFKGTGRVDELWDDWIQIDEKLGGFPVPSGNRPARIALAGALDATAAERAACLPTVVLAAADWTPAALAERLSAARHGFHALTERMVALQEELDWLTYGSYQLIDPVETVGPDAIGPLAPGHRPFEILAARADDEADEDEKSKWWKRHGHDRVTEVPARYQGAQRARLEARIAAIEADPRLQLLESFAYKRRWQTPTLWDLSKPTDETRTAANNWLLDRLEDLFAEGGALCKPRPYRLEAIVSALQADPRVPAVAAVAAGSASFELPRLVEALLKSHALPDHPWRIYSADGMRTRAAWLATWAAQDREDAGEKIEVPLPPKYAKTDFLRPEFFQTRGKLDVPRERFVAFADLGAPAWGWNGWRDLARATAQVEALEQVRHDPVQPLPKPSHDDPRRCGATLGLWASLDDVRRWVGPDEHEELRSFAQEACGQNACPCPLVARWQAWSRKEFEVKHPEPPAAGTGGVTIEEEAALLQRLGFAGVAGLPLDELTRWFPGTPERLATIIDGLVGRGQLVVTGKGARARYAKA